MGWRDDLRAAARFSAGFLGETLLKAAQPPDEAGPDEDQDRAPGGDNQDNAKNAPVPDQAAEDDPKALFWDPFAIIEQLGFKEKHSQITYGTLKAMVWKMPVIQAVIQTRLNQMASFARPQPDRYQLGFQIKLRDSEKQPSKAAKDWIKQAQILIQRTGVTDNPRGRDSFETFLRKVMWDSMTYDQLCHPAGTHIQTTTGSKPIEDIEVGDYVWTHKGRLRRVSELKHRIYDGGMHTVKARGQALSGTEGHPVYVVTDSNARFTDEVVPEWKPIAEVRPGMYLAYPQVTLPQEPVETPWGHLTPDLAWAMGLYAAEGHQQRGALTFTLASEFPELERLQSVFKGLGYKSTVTPYSERNAISVRINHAGDTRLGEFFAQCGRGSTRKRVPELLFKALPSQKQEFLRGYMLGDGCIQPTKISFSTTSRQLFEGLRILLSSEGIYASKLDVPEGGVPGSGWSHQYAANISGQRVRELFKLEGTPSRAREPYLVRDGLFLLRVNDVSIHEAHRLEVFNFEVEEDHSYLAEGYVSHNCFEIVPNRQGQPAEWYAVDASTIRLADRPSLSLNEDNTNAIRYVQIYDSQIIAEYTQEEMCFGVRNPRTDIRNYGYGTSELEMLVSTITAMLWSWEYNQKFFSQGSSQKGILNFKGPVPEKQLKAFRRHWYQMISGVENAWRTPITNADELQWISMMNTNKDMEFSAWMDFLIKVACSMYSMDPLEVNFKYGNAGQRSGLQEASNKEKITESKERGLRPLLRFLEQRINHHIIWPMNEDFKFEFVGLDAQTRDDMAKLNAQRVKTTWMVDELRAEEDLPPLPDGLGQVILDPTWMQAKAQKEGMAAQEQGQEQGQENLSPDEAANSDEQNLDFEKLLAAADEEDQAAQDEADQEAEDEEEAAKSLAKSRRKISIDLRL